VILPFRQLLEHHGLTQATFEPVQELHEEKGLPFRSGTIVDATIIAAPGSTKNASPPQGPKMKLTRVPHLGEAPQ
jgi:transposase, IS5 family